MINDPHWRRHLPLLIFVLLMAPPALASSHESMEAPTRALLQSAPGALCPDGIMDPTTIPETLTGALPGFVVTDISDHGPAQTWLRRQIRLENREKDQALIVSASRSSSGLRRVSFEIYSISTEQPIMVAIAGGDCGLRNGRLIRYAANGMAEELVHFAPDLETPEAIEPLNPPVPPGTDPGGVAVVHIDSGVNYLLPEIAARLARDGNGDLLGLDLWDHDDRPFDGDVGRSPFFPIRHGTPVASVLLREAPAVRLVPIRYPRPDMARMAEAVEFAARAGAKIVALPMGSQRPEDWKGFAEAVAAHPEILFIVSAGNNGRNIDLEPLYPASLPLENLVVVTSADAFGRLASGSNWGPRTVDLMIPAEKLEVMDYRGARGTASGSSYAVPRVAALVARLQAEHPDWTAAELKQALFARAVAPLERGAPRVRVGWIPNPMDDG